MATLSHNGNVYLRQAVVVIEMVDGTIHEYPATLGRNVNGQLCIASGGPPGQAPERSVTVVMHRVCEIRTIMRNGIIDV